MIDVSEDIAFLEECLLQYDTLEDKLYFLRLKERQKYHYYCDCGNNFPRTVDVAFHEVWNWILCKIQELEQKERDNIPNIRFEGYDDYVRDFEKLRNSPDILPNTEERIRERVEGRIRDCGADHYESVSFYLDEKYSNTGKTEMFDFSTKPDEEGNFLIRYLGVY